MTFDVVGSDGNTYDILLIRNPWGTNSNYPWTGDFSETSELWTVSAKEAVGYDVAMEDEG